jgi:hypothetical protein
LWAIIESKYIFRDLSATESAARCEMLDEQHVAFQDDDNFIKEMTGRL